MTKRRFLMLRPSTRAFFREAQRSRQPWFQRLHGYVYARWPFLYIAIAVGEHPLARLVLRLRAQWQRWSPSRRAAERKGDHDFAEGYHGKVVPLASASQLLTIKQEIRLPDLEQVIPYSRARDIVLQNPTHLVALDCPCRLARANPCLPLDVCLIVGEPFASFVVEHHPERARWISSAEALDILRAEDARGHVHHAFFKDAMLGRFYAICNCCACCCGAMQGHRNGVPMLAASGYVCQVDAATCLGCGTCVARCPFAALTLQEGHAAVTAAACMGCGICVAQCPTGALTLQRDAAHGEPLEIQALLAAAAESSPAQAQGAHPGS